MIHLRVISSPTFDMELLPTLERYTSGLSRHSENVGKGTWDLSELSCLSDV